MKTLAEQRLLAYIERLERINDEKAELGDQAREVMAEAKADGFNPSMIRNMIKLRKLEPNERDELEDLRALYKASLGLGGDAGGRSLSLAPASKHNPTAPGSDKVH